MDRELNDEYPGGDEIFPGGPKAADQIPGDPEASDGNKKWNPCVCCPCVKKEKRQKLKRGRTGGGGH